jgi:meiotic recombination protein SPO11
MAYDAKIMKLPEVKWLGVCLPNATKLNVPQHCLLPMTTKGVISHA